jgi:hypothetical protein
MRDTHVACAHQTPPPLYSSSPPAVPGGSIASMLGRFGKFNEDLVRNYTRQLLLGLEYLHGRGIVHRWGAGGGWRDEERRDGCWGWPGMAMGWLELPEPSLIPKLLSLNPL